MPNELEALRSRIAQSAAYLHVFDKGAAPFRIGPGMSCVTGTDDSGADYIKLANGKPNAAANATTDGYSIKLPDAVEAAASGRHVSIRVVARGGRFALAYSTNEVGNSGWRWHKGGPKWSVFTTEYDVPVMVEGNGDFIGLLPDSTGPGIDFCYLSISVGDKAEAAADPSHSYAGMKNVIDAELPHLGGNAHEDDAYTFAPSVWDYLIDRFAVRSALDLGAGLGYSSCYFHRAGVKVVAVDGLEYNVKHAIFPSTLVDLTVSRMVCRVDLVHCQEVVEHIEEKYLENLLLSLACGRFIVMTNALPGQGGHHHVNEQPTEYWIAHLKRHGCEVMAEDTKRVRALAERDGACYLAATGLVLTNLWF